MATLPRCIPPHPLRSCLIEGCLEKGRDYRNGGPLYNHRQILAEGIADTGDSLYAIKKLIFDEKKYTITVIFPQDLLDTKKNPENHRNLIVRVGGYSDYFTNLTTELQDNVINRTFMEM